MKYKIAFLIALLALMSCCATPCVLLNNITNVNVFKKAEQKKKKKVRWYFLFNKHLKFYYND